jgi:hypothetical protein
MATNLYPPPRPLSVGETIDLAFRIFRATLVTCLLFAGLAVIASELPNIYNLASGHPVRNLLEQHDPVFWLLDVVGTLLTVILWSAVLLRQYALVNGRGADAGSELTTGLRRLPALILLGILVALATAVWFIPVAALMRAGPAIVLVAVLVLSLPATYVAIMSSCAWLVLLVTGKGAVASLVHSWRLVTGSFWRLAAIYTVGLVLLFVLYALAGVLAVAVAVPLAHGDLAVATAVTTVMVVILSSLGTPFYTALALAVYGDLSVRREGADLAQRIAAAG